MKYRGLMEIPLDIQKGNRKRFENKNNHGFISRGYFYAKNFANRMLME